MPTLENYLLPEEKPLAESHVHVMIFFLPVLFYTLSLFLMYTRGSYAAFLGYFLFIASIFWGIYAGVRFGSLKLVLTNQRLLLHRGLFHKVYTGYFLKDIQTVVGEKSILGLLLNAGRIIVMLQNEKTFVLKPYSKPKEFSLQAQAAMKA